MLPSLEPLPSTTIQTLRGVVNVVLNDDELEWAGPSHEDKTTDMTMVVVRRKGLGIYKVGSRMVLMKVRPGTASEHALELTVSRKYRYHQVLLLLLYHRLTCVPPSHQPTPTVLSTWPKYP